MRGNAAEVPSAKVTTFHGDCCDAIAVDLAEGCVKVCLPCTFTQQIHRFLFERDIPPLAASATAVSSSNETPNVLRGLHLTRGQPCSTKSEPAAAADAQLPTPWPATRLVLSPRKAFGTRRRKAQKASAPCKHPRGLQTVTPCLHEYRRYLPSTGIVRLDGG